MTSGQVKRTADCSITIDLQNDMLHSYQFCDLAINSNVDFPELRPSSGNETCSLAFQLIPTRDWISVDRPFVPLWYRATGEAWVSYQAQAGIYLIRVADAAEFFVDPARCTIKCALLADFPLETVRHLLLDQILPLTLHLRGDCVLHASAIATELGAAAFLGVAGAGKSTLCTFLAMNGAEVLSDDCLLVRTSQSKSVVFPSYPGLRLWPSSVTALMPAARSLSRVSHYSDKSRIAEKGDMRFARTPAHLRVAFVLGPREHAGKDVSLQPCSPKNALLELVCYAFRLDLQNPEALEREFWGLRQLATSLDLVVINYPRRFDFLPAVRQAILAKLQQAQAFTCEI